MDVPDSAYGRGAGADAAIETVRRIYDAFARNDIEAAIAHIDPEAEFLPQGTAARIGRTAPYRGHDGIRAYFADARAVWRDLRITAQDFRSTAGGVVVFGEVEGMTDDGPVARRAVWVWRVRDGLATFMRVGDTGDIAPP